MSQQGLVFVTAGTGKTGRRVVERLAARQIPLRVGSRSAAIPFDWERPETWAAALDGAESVYITFQPDLAIPGADDTIRSFTAQAVAAGVRRLVLLSGRGEEAARACERIVQDAGAEWTIVRASWFSQNFSESFLLDLLRAGEMVLPVMDYPEPFIDADDIADVAVAALTEPGHNGQVYEVTGPRLLTFAQAISDIAEATGRPIMTHNVPLDVYDTIMTDAGLPADYVWLVHLLFELLMEGHNATLADGVQRALGRSPRDFSVYARETATTGVWDAVETDHA